MDRKSYWTTVGLWMALAALVFVGATGCHWTGSVGLGNVTGESKLVISEWAQANFLKAVDDLIAKVPDPNKDAIIEEEDNAEPPAIEHEESGVEDLGSGGDDGVDGG